MAAGIIAAVLLLGGGSYALFWGGGDGPAASVGSVNLSKGLVGHWRLDGNTSDSTPYRDNAAASNISIVQGPIYGSASNQNSASATWPATTTTGDTLLAIVTVNNSGYGGPVPPAGWTLRQGQSGSWGWYIFEINNAAPRTGPETFTWGATNDASLWLLELSGVSTATPDDIVATYSGDKNSITPNVTLGAGAGMAFVVADTNDGGCAGPSAFKTNGWDSTGGYRANLGYQLVNGGQQVSATFSATCSWRGAVFSYNTASPDGASLTADRKGVANQAYSFNGSSGSIGVYTANLPAVNKAQTLSAWFNPRSSSGTQALIGLLGSGVGNQIVLNSGLLRMTEFGGTGTNGISVSLNTWHMATYTYDGSSCRLYLDDQQVASATSCVQTGASNYMVLGSDGSGKWFNGSLADARVYNRAITADEVKALYNSYDDPMDLANGENGLVGWWKLGGNAKDSTPYRDNGTINGTVTPTTGPTSIPNTAMSFDGSTGYVRTPSLAVVPSSQMSICAWIKTSAVNEYIAQGGRSSTDNIGEYVFQLDSTGRLDFWDYGTGGYGFQVASTGSVNNNLWHNVCFTKNGTSGVFYIDGVSEVVSGLQDTAYAAHDFVIGENYRDSNSYFSGSISDVRIYNRTLTQADVTDLYNSYGSQLDVGGDGQANGINLAKGLVGRWAMDGNIKDSTPYRTVCTPPTGSPSYTTDRMGGANRAMSPPKLGLDCGQPTALRVSNITMSSWINASSINSNGNGIESYGGTTQLYVSSSSNEILFTVHDSLNQAHTFGSTAAIGTGQWYFVAVTYDGSTVKIYVNGVLDSSASYTGGIGTNHYNDSGNDFELGEYSAPSTLRSFQGALDDVRLYNRALGANEIKALYNEYQ